MRCSVVMPSLDAFLDGELPLERTLDLQAHLDECESCREQERLGRAMRASLQHLQPVGVSTALERRIRESLAQAAEQEAAEQEAEHEGAEQREAHPNARLARREPRRVLVTPVARRWQRSERRRHWWAAAGGLAAAAAAVVWVSTQGLSRGPLSGETASGEAASNQALAQAPSPATGQPQAGAALGGPAAAAATPTAASSGAPGATAGLAPARGAARTPSTAAALTAHPESSLAGTPFGSRAPSRAGSPASLTQFGSPPAPELRPQLVSNSIDTPVSDDEPLASATLVDEFINIHSTPPKPQVTQPQLVGSLERAVGVSVRLPGWQQRRVAWQGASVVQIRRGRVAFLRYRTPDNHSVTLYVYDATRIPLHAVLQPKRLKPEPVYMAERRGYSIAALQRQGIGYALATDLDSRSSLELISHLR